MNPSKNDMLVKRRHNFILQDWKLEWDIVTKATHDTFYDRERETFEYLKEIHIFALANILKRPIVILCENVVRTLQGSALDLCHFPGIYLPLMWKDSDIYQSPLVLAYDTNHFCPLISQSDGYGESMLASTAIHAVPLVTHDLSPLHIPFLLPHEEDIGHILLTRYLKVQEVVLTKADSIVHILAATLEHIKIEPELDIMRDICEQAEQTFEAQSQEQTEAIASGWSKMKVSNTVDQECSAMPVIVCKTEGCKFNGAVETRGLCSQCFMEYTKQSSVKHSHTQHYLPTKPEAEMTRSYLSTPSSTSTPFEKKCTHLSAKPKELPMAALEEHYLPRKY